LRVVLMVDLLAGPVCKVCAYRAPAQAGTW